MASRIAEIAFLPRRILASKITCFGSVINKSIGLLGCYRGGVSRKVFGRPSHEAFVIARTPLNSSAYDGKIVILTFELKKSGLANVVRNTDFSKAIQSLLSKSQTVPPMCIGAASDRVKNWRDFGFALEGCGFHLRRDSSRAGLLPGSDRHAKNQGQPSYSSHAAVSQRRAKAPEREICIGRASGFSNPQWHPVQRYQSAAQVLETGRTEARDALAQLAHSAPNSRHALTARGSNAQRGASAVGSLEDVHHLELYTISIPAAQRKAVENLSDLVTNGDELGQLGGKLPLATERIL
jgi:hypothetical protein